MTSHSAPSMRVLNRPRPAQAPSLPPIPSSSSPSSSSTSAHPDPQSPSQGTVVVGFISRRPDYSAHLIDRVLDFPAFGSGGLDKILQIDKDEVRDWFKHRRISYYHDEEKGILYLQYCSTHCPVVHGSSTVGSGLDSPEEEQEFGDLQGMLFMFSVCHVVIYIMEGSRFETQTLQNFRLLQSAKHALAPFVRSRTMPLSSSRPPTSSSRPTVSMVSSSSISPSKGRISGRGSSGISIMSGLGSYASLFPGQCTPVILFIFIDDYLDSTSSATSSEEVTESLSSLNMPANLSGLPRSSLTTKGSGSVVMLARPVNKSEGSFKKKLQSSLETQIRFLIKKCRTLSGSENGQPGSRSAGASSSAPLFLLDTSRIAVLLERVTNQRGESLEFATGLVEDVLKGKATSDSLLLESYQSQNANKEDTISIREFIHRQCDVLRGRGGLMGTANGGGGMVAVAAAAAAASVASGKAFAAPELPSLELWLSMSEVVLHGILTGKRGFKDDNEITRRKSRQRNVSPPHRGPVTSSGAEPQDIAVSWLERGKGLNAKFSTSWCQKALPMAKEVYLKDLPPCYRTSQHEAHLEKALHAFHSMVKGPSVPHFAKLLEDECSSIWTAGRQQCDAMSLTEKPCMHRKHNVEEAGSLHSSGYVFLHACACGRSRRLREDPFDFDSANVTNCFSDCDKLLPALELPDIKITGPIKPSSWSLIRVGSSKYYEPSKGLMQSGFSSSQKFLLKWTICLDKKQKTGNQQPLNADEQNNLVRSGRNSIVELNAASMITRNPAEIVKSRSSRPGTQDTRPAENVFSDEKKISFGRGLPNFTMRKPFSEVVAGSAAADLAFPPLQQRKPPQLVSENGAKQSTAVDRKSDPKEANKLKDNSSDQETSNRNPPNGFQTGDPFLRIGSNIVPVNMIPGENIELDTSPEQVVAYVGFEHECPHGHRFLLTPKHLNELGSLYSSHESNVASLETTLDSTQAHPPRSGGNGSRDKVHSGSSSFSKKRRNMNKSRGTSSNGQISRQEKEYSRSDSMSGLSSELGEDVQESLSCPPLDNSGSAFCMLNRNLPIYMNCAFCKHSKDNAKAKFAGTVSQLQRIFLVTPPSPVVLAASPAIQFKASCLPSAVPAVKQRLQFSLGCQDLFVVVGLQSEAPQYLSSQLVTRTCWKLELSQDPPIRALDQWKGFTKPVAVYTQAQCI
ncbi:hypothetical protein CDL15_Pgr025122 [Punica granatum]|uniref:Nonsense-mediated mRNA decay factor SMG8 n=1 Tax=Punica granatum TaxID=22663 RepID=A0A218W811_PUNGR|nr:hypothetical protein CDL15_Pgr025122 [Punica granatum]